MDLPEHSSKPTALTDWAYQTIRDAILHLRVAPGAQLHIDELAEQMGTSRTPVREALLRLEAEGLVRIVPRVGFFVTEITARDMRELFELRQLLESYAATRAAAVLTDDDLRHLEHLVEISTKAVEEGHPETFLQAEIEFHTFLLERAQNRHLLAMMESIRNLTYRERILSLRSLENLRTTLIEHRRVLDALRQRDGALAGRMMQEHVCSARDRLLAFADLPPERVDILG